MLLDFIVFELSAEYYFYTSIILINAVSFCSHRNFLQARFVDHVIYEFHSINTLHITMPTSVYELKLVLRAFHIRTH